MAWQNRTPEELEWQYNPRVTVPDFAVYFERGQALSRDTRDRLPHRPDIRYGPGPLETLDLYPAAAAGAPVHVFFHGGYWRGQDKADYAFVARDLAPRGISVAVANYDLCPAVTVGDIVAECIRCIRFIAAHAGALGVDASRLSVSGHSAGGQLVAKLLTHDWAGDGMAHPVRSAVAISGVFELEPLRHTSLNEAIRLTAASARANSPLLDPAPPADIPLLLAVGADESDEFRDQTGRYAEHCSAAGCPVESIVPIAGNHFSVLEALFLEAGAHFADLLLRVRGAPA